jgi:hypothetical protein
MGRWKRRNPNGGILGINTVSNFEHNVKIEASIMFFLKRWLQVLSNCILFGHNFLSKKVFLPTGVVLLVHLS